MKSQFFLIGYMTKEAAPGDDGRIHTPRDTNVAPPVKSAPVLPTIKNMSTDPTRRAWQEALQARARRQVMPSPVPNQLQAAVPGLTVGPAMRSIVSKAPTARLSLNPEDAYALQQPQTDKLMLSSMNKAPGGVAADTTRNPAASAIAAEQRGAVPRFRMYPSGGKAVTPEPVESDASEGIQPALPLIPGLPTYQGLTNAPEALKPDTRYNPEFLDRLRYFRQARERVAASGSPTSTPAGPPATQEQLAAMPSFPGSPDSYTPERVAQMKTLRQALDGSSKPSLPFAGFTSGLAQVKSDIGRVATNLRQLGGLASDTGKAALNQENAVARQVENNLANTGRGTVGLGKDVAEAVWNRAKADAQTRRYNLQRKLALAQEQWKNSRARLQDAGQAARGGLGSLAGTVGLGMSEVADQARQNYRETAKELRERLQAASRGVGKLGAVGLGAARMATLPQSNSGRSLKENLLAAGQGLGNLFSARSLNQTSGGYQASDSHLRY